MLVLLSWRVPPCPSDPQTPTEPMASFCLGRLPPRLALWEGPRATPRLLSPTSRVHVGSVGHGVRSLGSTRKASCTPQTCSCRLAPNSTPAPPPRVACSPSFRCLGRDTLSCPTGGGSEPTWAAPDAQGWCSQIPQPCPVPPCPTRGHSLPARPSEDRSSFSLTIDQQEHLQWA